MQNNMEVCAFLKRYVIPDRFQSDKEHRNCPHHSKCSLRYDANKIAVLIYLA